MLIPLVSAMAWPAAGQSLSDAGVVEGRVVDPSGRAIASASVALRSSARATVWTVRTDAEGRFRFAPVPVGAHHLAAEAPGFRESARDLVIGVGQSFDLTVTLSLGAVAQSIEVTSSAAVVDLTRAEAAGHVTPHEIETLPLNGRNYLDLATLLPGVSRTVIRNAERFAETSAVPGTGISVQSQRNTGNTVIVDGLSANDDAADLAGTFFTQEVVREFEVVTSAGRAEFGRAAAGVLSIVTQSGTTQFRGRGYGFFRDDALDARNAFATRKDPLSQSQYGGTVGGPLGRAFLFANIERTDASRRVFVTVSPSNVERVNHALDALGYPGPRLATGETPTTMETSNLFGRADWALGQGDRLALRYSFYDVGGDNARNVGGLNAETRGTSLDNRDQTVAATYVRAHAAQAVFEVRAAATRSRLLAPPNDLIGPAVTIAGVASFGTATSSPTARALDTGQAAAGVTLARGSHVMKGGVDLLVNHADIAFPGAVQGVYTFSSLSAFEAGKFVTFQQAFGEPSQRQSNPNLGLFVQDEWRMSQDLTLTAGLRYDAQWLAGPIRTDANNFGPRVGIAWAPGDRRTVVRASTGLFYDRVPLRALSNALQRDGIKYQVAVLADGQAGAPRFPAVASRFPDGQVTAITTMDPGIQNARSVQTAVQVERQIGGHASVAFGYLGLRGRSIIMSRNINVPTLSAAEAAVLGIANLGRPDPRYANVSQFQSIGRSSADAFTMALNGQWTRAGQQRVSYTFGRALDDAGNFFFSSPQDNNDVPGDWGPSDNDQRHHLVASGSTALGPLTGWSAAAPWQVSYVLAFASAPPFNIQTGTDRNQDTNVNDRPVGVGRNSGRAWASAALDVRLSWRGSVNGRLTIEAMAEAFNVLNRVNLRNPNNTFGPGAAPLPAFGTPTAADDPRQVQLGLRVSF